jgi:uncharacterized membrane protein YraQ (UPF0718 family)
MSEKAPHSSGERFEPLNEHEAAQAHERIKHIHETAPEKQEKSREEIEEIRVEANHEAKSVGRPSGIIGGGLMALIGTSIYYYLSRHYGYSYNSFVFLLLMLVGFVLGWSIEVTIKFYKAFSKK